PDQREEILTRRGFPSSGHETGSCRTNTLPVTSSDPRQRHAINKIYRELNAYRRYRVSDGKHGRVAAQVASPAAGCVLMARVHVRPLAHEVRRGNLRLYCA